jgi:hypothetical protein
VREIAEEPQSIYGIVSDPEKSDWRVKECGRLMSLCGASTECAGKSLNFLRSRFLVRGALAHNGCGEAATEIVWQLVEFLVAVDLDGLASCVADDVTVVAPRQMVFEFDFGLRVESVV